MKKLWRILTVTVVFSNCSTAFASTGDLINIQFGLSNLTPSYTGQAAQPALGSNPQVWNRYDALDDIPPRKTFSIKRLWTL